MLKFHSLNYSFFQNFSDTSLICINVSKNLLLSIKALFLFSVPEWNSSLLGKNCSCFFLLHNSYCQWWTKLWSCMKDMTIKESHVHSDHKNYNPWIGLVPCIVFHHHVESSQASISSIVSWAIMSWFLLCCVIICVKLFFSFQWKYAKCSSRKFNEMIWTTCDV